jgi:hypothetical protein
MPDNGEALEASQLKPPAYVWEQSLGPCGAEAAMDGDGLGWREGGCENGPKRFRKDRPLTPEQQSAVRRAFEALPTPNKDCDWSDRFMLRAADGTTKWWFVCNKQGHHPNPLEIDGIPPPFDAAARALKH